MLSRGSSAYRAILGRRSPDIATMRSWYLREAVSHGREVNVKRLDAAAGSSKARLVQAADASR